MIFKIALLIIFVAATIYIGYYSRKKATSVDGFVLGGRKIGPWMSAFAYGTSYFSAVVFIGYAGQFGWKFGLAAFWAALGRQRPRQHQLAQAYPCRQRCRKWCGCDAGAGPFAEPAP